MKQANLINIIIIILLDFQLNFRLIHSYEYLFPNNI